MTSFFIWGSLCLHSLCSIYRFRVNFLPVSGGWHLLNALSVTKHIICQQTAGIGKFKYFYVFRLTPNRRVISFRADVLAIRDYRSFKNLPPRTALTQAAARLLAQDDMSILSYGTASRASRNHPAKNAFDSVLLYSFSVPAPT